VSALLPLIVIAALNETTTDDDNPNFPFAPDELVREAVAARAAGASVVHFHARDPETRGLGLAPELYLPTFLGIREQTDLLIEPGLGLIADPAADRISHLTTLDVRPDFAPVEMGAFNVDFWDPDAGRFSTGDALYALTRGRIEAVLVALRDAGYRPSASCWDFGHVRTARRFREMGLLPEPTLWELTFTGELVPSGAPPTVPALHGLLSELPRDEPWSVGCWQGDILPLAAIAIELGGHVRIGLGDWPYRQFGTPHHGDLVAAVVELARRAGREVATPDQARELLRLATVAA
jgi:uncharacterized protein (DUF849 family)